MTLNSNAQSLFDSDDVLDVQIVAPLTTFSRVRSDIDYLDGTFGFTDEAGLAQSFDLKMRARKVSPTKEHLQFSSGSFELQDRANRGNDFRGRRQAQACNALSK
ncbi:MAG: hypothetical protein O3A13_06825 [Proteobacteria bacterium]|nr:hypothetical protein [Pseudomonadota bacterium]